VQGGFGPRFALEAGFLIAVAIGAGFAELSATAIVVGRRPQHGEPRRSGPPPTGA